MRQLHFHERGAHVVLYNATTRRLYNRYAEFNTVVEELEALGREDLVRQGFAAEDVRYRLELDMRYGNQLLTQAVTLDINRISGVEAGGVRDPHLRRCLQPPVRGGLHRERVSGVGTIRVASYVDGDVVRFDSLEYGGARRVPAGRPPHRPLRRRGRAREHPDLRHTRSHTRT